jgi:hypothetical protein
MIDFFISYTHADTAWAEWIGYVLEEEKFSVIIQAWDFRPGNNFVLEMQEAAAKASRTLMVLSPDYLQSQFASPEWAAAFGQDPQGRDMKLVPVMVRTSQPAGLLTSIVQIRIDGIDEGAARQKLIAGINQKRAKPSARPRFPGPEPHVQSKPFPGPSSAGPSSAIVRHSTSKSGRFVATAEDAGSFLEYSVEDNGNLLSFADVFDLWRDVEDFEFVDFYISLFKQSGYRGYAWETPPISKASINRKFEFVILNQPRSSGRPDREQYDEHYDTKNAPDGIVCFPNWDGDALLIVPSPFRKDADYSGMAEFFRDAPISQQRGLWRELARHAKSRLCDRPMRLSVAGSGIRWLHLRIDSEWKYHKHEAYKLK